MTSWLTPHGALTGTFSGSGADVAALADGSVVVAGSFSGSGTFGLGEPNETVLTTGWPNSTLNDVFVARYDRDGALVWARSAGGIGQDIATNVAALGDGTVLVAGSFTADATFGAGEPRETVLRAPGRGSFVARFDGRTGALVWARAMDLQYYSDCVRGLAGGMDGSAFVTGTFYGSGTFGPGEAGQTTLLSAGGFDVFVARLSP